MATSNKNYIIQAPNTTNWGNNLNDYMITYVDLNLGGLKNQSLSNTNVTLTTDDSRNVIYRLTGSLSANVTVYLDATVSNGFCIVENLTSGNYTVTIANTTPATATTTVDQGTRALLISDNTNGVRIAAQTYANLVNTFSAGSTGLTPSTATSGAVTLAGTLNVANGGTGQTTLTANNLLVGNGTSGVQTLAPGTSGNFAISNGTSWTSTNTANSNLSIGGNLSFNSGYGSAALAYGCRAWVNFNAVGFNGTYSQSGTTISVTATNHGLSLGQSIYLYFTSGTAVSANFTVSNVVSANVFQVVAGGSLTTSGNVQINNIVTASGNVSSVIWNQTGDYIINFTNAMPDTNYVAFGSAGSPNGGGFKDGDDNGIVFGRSGLNGLRSTTQLRCWCAQGGGSGGREDSSCVNIVVFR